MSETTDSIPVSSSSDKHVKPAPLAGLSWGWIVAGALVCIFLAYNFWPESQEEKMRREQRAYQRAQVLDAAYRIIAMEGLLKQPTHVGYGLWYFPESSTGDRLEGLTSLMKTNSNIVVKVLFPISQSPTFGPIFYEDVPTHLAEKFGIKDGFWAVLEEKPKAVASR